LSVALPAAAQPAVARSSLTEAAHAHARTLLPWLQGLAGGSPTPEAAAPRRRVAVVGAGITGLGAAYALRDQAEVHLFEADPRLGGHANTVDVTLDGVTHGVDTGFLVCNERTYPLLLELFRQLDVPLAHSEMSFSVQNLASGLEWSGTDLNGVFAQRRNLARPAFWGMLSDLLRFNKLCTALAASGNDAALAESIADFLQRERFGAAFRDGYLLPMIACIWSCPAEQMLRFPVGTLIRFCHNHGLLQISGRPQWFTVRGGSRVYVERIRQALQHVHVHQAVQAVTRLPSGEVQVRSAAGVQTFDAVIMATHSDQALRLLTEPSPREQQLLGAVRYQSNEAVLHTDERLLPQRRRAWAAWNYEANTAVTQEDRRPVCLHYLINALQPLPWQRPVVVSLNPLRQPAEAHVLQRFEYAHPVLDEAAVAAQAHLPEIQGQGGVWFAGAWTRYGFHEDGLLSGLQAAHAVAHTLRSRAA
jgi:uncharacterized protein